MSSSAHLANAAKRKRFSREGFKLLPTQHQANMGVGDATIDIPLEQVPTANAAGSLQNQSRTAALRPIHNGLSPGNERRFHFRGHRVKVPKAAEKTRIDSNGKEEILTTMGKMYKKLWSFSIVTRYLLIVAPLALLIAVPIVIGAINVDHGHPTRLAGVPLVWFFTWIEIVWLSLWVAKIVVHYLPVLFQLCAGVMSAGVRKYAMVIQALEIPLSLVGWAVTSLATFMPLMTLHKTPQQQWMFIVQKILGASVVASLILLVEKLIVQLLSISYHRKQFRSRIKDSKHNVYLLGLLYEVSRSLFPAYCNEFAEEDYIIADQLNISLGFSRGDHNKHARSGSATPMRIIHDIGRYGDKLTSAFGNVAHEITGKEVFNPNSAHSIVVEALEKNRTAEALARRIWMSFVVEGREALFEEDVVDVLGPERKTEAEESFAALDRDGNGDISLDEMILTVNEFGRERKAVTSSMHDVDQAINVLDRLLCTVVFIAVVFVFVAFLNTNFTTTLATTGTALLSLSFVFAATCQEVLGSCIFLFVKHPYDIGDRVDISTDQLVVEHISLLFTVFRRATGTGIGRLVQIPNIVLNTLYIENVSRSTAMSEQLEIDIAFGTTFDDIQILKQELQAFVQEKENSRDFQLQFEVGILGSSDQSKLQLQVEIKHKSNWANETIRQARRSKFMCGLVSALKKVPIYPPGGGSDPAGTPGNPTYSVAISDQVAKKNAAESAKAKEGLRMVPTRQVREAKPASSPASSAGPAGFTRRDNKILDNLHSRDPASDPARDEAWTSTREDSSTLGERPSIDRQDLEDVRGLLRRESTKGKRKPSVDERPTMQAPSVPTIAEPQPGSYAAYEQQRAPGYENQQPGYNMMPASYGPPLRTQPTLYQSAQSVLPTPSQNVDMRQVQPVRSPSNPYRKRSESINRKPLSPTAGSGERSDDEFEKSRPYSGV